MEAALAEGRRHGLAGAELLDYFYLVHRLADRSGLGARSGRYSACATPAFVRAAFDLNPEQRLDGKLHLELIARLVPERSEVPFFDSDEAAPQPETRRARIWEKPGHAETVEEMIADGKAWPQLFRRRPVRGAWKDARAGKAHHHWEAVFNRIVWREGFEEHLRELGRAATPSPPAGLEPERRPRCRQCGLWATSHGCSRDLDASCSRPRISRLAADVARRRGLLARRRPETDVIASVTRPRPGLTSVLGEWRIPSATTMSPAGRSTSRRVRAGLPSSARRAAARRGRAPPGDQ